MRLLFIFAAGAGSVFLLGFQSRNVNHGNYRLAAACSLLIGLTQARLWQEVARPGSSWPEAIAYALSGAIGIVAAMWVHDRFVKPQEPRA